jgi:hypothetical protein
VGTEFQLLPSFCQNPETRLLKASTSRFWGGTGIFETNLSHLKVLAEKRTFSCFFLLFLEGRAPLFLLFWRDEQAAGKIGKSKGA